DPPHRKPDAAIEYDVEVRRVLERDVVEHRIVGLREDDQARTALAQVPDLRVLRQIPPRNIFAEQLRPPAAVDGPRTHDRDAVRLVRRDEWLATMALLVDGAAPSVHVVDLRIARPEDDRVRVDDQRHTGLEGDRSDQECARISGGLQYHGLAACASVDR